MSRGVLHKFYCSEEWKKFRNVIIQERSNNGGIKCQECGRYILKGNEIHIHHSPVELTEQNYTDKSISLNPDNVMLVCKTCHDKLHGRFCAGHKKRTNGVYIVYGPPLSGKSTYVRQHMNYGDIVVDLDAIAMAISYMDMHDKPDNLKYNVFAIRNELIKQIKTRYGSFKNAWIIGGYPNRADRDRLVSETGAEIIYVEATREECMTRLEACNGYRSKHKKEWSAYIDKWFEMHT